jgi:cell division protein FtsA
MHNILTAKMNEEKIDMDKVVCAVDIGTSKVAALVGRRNQFGKIEILGIGICPSFGVARGVVVSITKTVDSIRKAVQKAEEQSGISFTKVHVGIAGQHIKSIQNRSQINRTNTDSWITHEDVRKLKNESFKIALPPGDKILHVLQQEFIIDNEPGIQDPVGMMGVKMEGNFHIITGGDSHIQNIERCVRAAGLEIASIELEPLASADAVLSKQELEAGVALVDIGGGTTDIAIFENYIIRHTAVIPLGGNIITEDLRDFRILREQAEELKVKLGAAIPTEDLRNQHVTIEGIQPGIKRELNLMSVAKVISARMIEILANVEHQIKMSGYSKKLIGGIVLTGGGSQLKHLVQLSELETGQNARVGLPREHLASTKISNIDNPIFATGIGLLIRAFKMYDEEELIETEKREKLGINRISTIADVQSIEPNIITQTEDGEIKDKEQTKKEEEKNVDDNGTKKPSIVSSWFEKFGNWVKSDTDFTDV